MRVGYDEVRELAESGQAVTCIPAVDEGGNPTVYVVDSHACPACCPRAHDPADSPAHVGFALGITIGAHRRARELGLRPTV